VRVSEIASVLYGREDIRRRIEELGRTITGDYAGREPVLVSVLRGGAMFLADPDRWEEDVEPFVHQTVDARNRTAHPSREAPPLDRVRELIYTSFRLLESVLKAPKGVAA